MSSLAQEVLRKRRVLDPDFRNLFRAIGDWLQLNAVRTNVCESERGHKCGYAAGVDAEMNVRELDCREVGPQRYALYRSSVAKDHGCAAEHLGQLPGVGEGRFGGSLRRWRFLWPVKRSRRCGSDGNLGNGGIFWSLADFMAEPAARSFLADSAKEEGTDWDTPLVCL